jgi:curved DNA-binding protein CbpA
MALLPLDPYKILGVASDASMSDIKPAWRKLVLKCHPDKFPDPEVKEVQMEEFQRIQTAYELLSNDSARADYDRMVAVREHRAKVASSSNSKAPPWEVKSGDRSDSGKDNIYAYQEDIWEGYQRRERGTEKQFRARSRVRPPSQNISLSDERQEFVAYALQLFDEVHNSVTLYQCIPPD